MEQFLTFFKEHIFSSIVITIVTIILLLYIIGKVVIPLVKRILIGLIQGIIIAVLMYFLICPFLHLPIIWTAYVGGFVFLMGVCFGKVNLNKDQ